jgi:hypothetical protein
MPWGGWTGFAVEDVTSRTTEGLRHARVHTAVATTIAALSRLLLLEAAAFHDLQWPRDDRLHGFCLFGVW